MLGQVALPCYLSAGPMHIVTNMGSMGQIVRRGKGKC